MMKKSVLLAYLKSRRISLLLLLLCAGIFAVVFSLYHLPVDAVGYAALLCGAVGALLLAADFAQFRARHKALALLAEGAPHDLADMPAPRGLIEADYTALLAAVMREKDGLLAAAEAERADMLDYYTLWAHQIKTPIAAMRLLLQSEETAKTQALTAELFKIEQYVNMVLSYLRLQSETNDFVIRRVPLDPVVRLAVRKYAPQFIQSKIRLDYRPIRDEALTDEKWLGFVIEQVLSNALKYTPKGTITIYAEAGPRIVIEDTGIGIAAEDLPRLCQKGYTGYNGRTEHKSTGLGLFLCKKILTKLSHSIQIESTVGKGTKITIGLETADIRME